MQSNTQRRASRFFQVEDRIPECAGFDGPSTPKKPEPEPREPAQPPERPIEKPFEPDEPLPMDPMPTDVPTPEDPPLDLPKFDSRCA